MLVTFPLHLEVFNVSCFGEWAFKKVFTTHTYFNLLSETKQNIREGERKQRSKDGRSGREHRPEWKNTLGHLRRRLWRLVLHKQKLEKFPFFVLLLPVPKSYSCVPGCSFQVLRVVIAQQPNTCRGLHVPSDRCLHL